MATLVWSHSRKWFKNIYDDEYLYWWPVTYNTFDVAMSVNVIHTVLFAALRILFVHFIISFIGKQHLKICNENVQLLENKFVPSCTETERQYYSPPQKVKTWKRRSDGPPQKVEKWGTKKNYFSEPVPNNLITKLSKKLRSRYYAGTITLTCG